MQSNEDIAIRAAQDQNVAAFEEQRADLELESPGLWALFRDGRLVNTYDTQQFAMESAERRFGQGPHFITQIAEEPEAAFNTDLPLDGEKRPFAALALQFTWKTLTIVAVIALWIADRIIALIPAGFDLYARIANKDVRRVAPTKRIPWEKGLKQRLMRRQSGRCAYCGSRFAAHLFEIDHMDPVSRGGSNDVNNLQVLCRRCNGRKSEQTDAEFRRRFRGLVPPRRLTPPSPPVNQKRFDAVATTTRASAELRAFRRTRYVGAEYKIGMVSLIIGIGVAAAAQVGLMGLVSWDYWWILSVTLGVIVGGGLYLRAWRTGALNL